MLLVIALLSYLMGSLSLPILLSHWMELPGLSDREAGNPGISNLLHLGHKRLALVLLLGDSLKTIIPLLIAKSHDFNETQLAWVAAAASIGHLFSIFFTLQGGKGIITVFGALLVISWPVAGIALGTWLSALILFRYTALASVLAIFSILLSTHWFCLPATCTPIALISGISLAKHHSHWIRFLKRKEAKLKILDHL